MCGIIGIISENSAKNHDHAQAMANCLAHRGPDGEGLTSSFTHCILGQRRLAIVDLATGAQPMYNEAGTIALTFNGEIYGYQDIKKKLPQYNFRTTSDTEVILALYETRGEKKADFVRELPGMFAFALWDDTTRTLIAARDRFGEKPFYYATGKNGEFIFASEIKAILASGLVTPVLDENALAYMLKKLAVHPHQTIYSNIHVLPPAHTLTYKNGDVRVERYWHMPELRTAITLEEALPEFKRLLTDAVRKQMVADVPVGAFLSGGLDSTTIVGIASQFNPKLKTFSFGFEGYKNELGFARMAAEKYGTDHHELRDTDYNIADLILLMGDIYDEPFADSSNIPTYLISKKTREHAKVVLSGDAGDELLGGYAWYKSLIVMSEEEARRIPGKQLFMKMLANIAQRRNWKNKVRIISKARGLHYQAKYDSVFEAHQASNVYFANDEIADLGIRGRTPPPIPSWQTTNTVDDGLKSDLEEYIPSDILTKVDRASMAASLELRAPLLDVPFAEFAISLPYQLKLTNDEDKILLRRAYAESWPEAIRTRSKQGFGAPFMLWLKKPEVAALVEEYLNDPRKKIFQFISFKASRKYISHMTYKTWILLSLSIWMEKHTFESPRL